MSRRFAIRVLSFRCWLCVLFVAFASCAVVCYVLSVECCCLCVGYVFYVCLFECFVVCCFPFILYVLFCLWFVFVVCYLLVCFSVSSVHHLCSVASCFAVVCCLVCLCHVLLCVVCCVLFVVVYLLFTSLIV